MTPAHLLIVPRADPQLFDYLSRRLSGVSRVEVILDRRAGERRRSDRPAADRRRGERRSPAFRVNTTLGCEEFMARHVITPFTVPAHWTKFRSMDWGSASPFAVHWLTVVQDDFEHDGCARVPAAAHSSFTGSGCRASCRPNCGLKLTAEEVAAAGIVSRETSKDGRGGRTSLMACLTQAPSPCQADPA